MPGPSYLVQGKWVFQSPPTAANGFADHFNSLPSSQLGIHPLRALKWHLRPGPGPRVKRFLSLALKFVSSNVSNLRAFSNPT